MARKSLKSVFAEPEETEIDSHDDTSLEHEEEEGQGDGRSISKAEAARRTLAEGIELPRKASVHIKEKYGLDISPQQFSAEKSRL